MSIFTAVYLSTCAVNGQYRCMYLVALLFKSPSFHQSKGRLQSVFGVLLCSCQLFSKHSGVICLRFHPFQFSPLFYGFTSVHLIEFAVGRFILLLKAHFFFFIAAISLLFKSKDNVFLSILLHPFQWRVQGFSPSRSLSFSEGIWGTPERGASLGAQLSDCNEP